MMKIKDLPQELQQSAKLINTIAFPEIKSKQVSLQNVKDVKVILDETIQQNGSFYYSEINNSFAPKRSWSLGDGAYGVLKKLEEEIVADAKGSNPLKEELKGFSNYFSVTSNRLNKAFKRGEISPQNMRAIKKFYKEQGGSVSLLNLFGAAFYGYGKNTGEHFNTASKLYDKSKAVYKRQSLGLKIKLFLKDLITPFQGAHFKE